MFLRCFIKICKSGHCKQVFCSFWTEFGWPMVILTGGRCSEVNLVLKLLGQDLGWLFLTGGRYSEVVVSTGLTVPQKTF